MWNAGRRLSGGLIVKIFKESDSLLPISTFLEVEIEIKWILKIYFERRIGRILLLIVCVFLVVL